MNCKFALTCFFLLILSSLAFAQLGYPKTAAYKGGDCPTDYAMYSKFDLVLMSWSCKTAAQQIKALNPNSKILFYHPADGTWGNAGNWGGYAEEQFDAINDNNWWLYSTNDEKIFNWCVSSGSHSPVANITNYCPRASTPYGENQTYIEWLPFFSKKIFTENPEFDGVFLDSFTSNISWFESISCNAGKQIDADNDGIADDDLTLNSQWISAHNSFLSALKGKIGSKAVTINSPAGTHDSQVNGRMIESFPVNNSNWQSRMFGAENGYLHASNSNSGSPFQATMALSYSSNGSEKEKRFSLTSALLGNGFYGFASGTPKWLPEFDLGGTQKHFLGQPTSSYQALANGVYRRNFQNGIVLVNPASSTQTTALEKQFKIPSLSSDPGFWNGAIVDSVSLNSADGIILLNFSGTCPEVPCESGKICCSNSCIAPECANNSGCDDGNPNTSDVCNNPNSCNASCSHNAIPLLCGNGAIDSGENCSNCPQDVGCVSGQLCCDAKCIAPKCTKNLDCDDSNPNTKDECLNPNSCTAVCSNAPIDLCDNGLIDFGENCFNCPADVKCAANEICCESQCIKPICFNSAGCDDFNPDTTDACVYPNKCNSFCRHQSEQTCNGIKCSNNQICCEGRCVFPECFIDSDCDDKDNCTNDICMHSAQCNSKCSNVLISNCSYGKILLEIPKEVEVGKSFSVAVKTETGIAVEKAQVFYGTEMKLTDSKGRVSFIASQDYSKISASKNMFETAIFFISLVNPAAGLKKLSVEINRAIIEGEEFEVKVADGKGNPVRSADVSYGAISKQTNENGIVSFVAQKEVKVLTASSEGFATEKKDLSIAEKFDILSQVNLPILLIALVILIFISSMIFFTVK